MSHTEGKLKADGALIKNQNGEMVAATEGSQSNHEANARRLVACWNALLPFTTEQVENGIDLVKLMQERDELLATLRDLYLNGNAENVESILAKYEEEE